MYLIEARAVVVNRRNWTNEWGFWIVVKHSIGNICVLVNLWK